MIVVACGIVRCARRSAIERYGDSPALDSIGDIFKLNEGGISIYGAIIGGAIGNWSPHHGLWKKLPAAVAPTPRSSCCWA